jgi:Transcription factor WhiB
VATLQVADPSHLPPGVHTLCDPLPDLPGAACVGNKYLNENSWTGGAPYADQQLARVICRTSCPALAACRTFALTPTGMSVPGIVGGLSEGERRPLRRAAAS